MSVKLLISDLDGTLLGPDSRITPQTADALSRAHQAGIRLLVATGRSWSTASPFCNRQESYVISYYSTGRNVVPQKGICCLNSLSCCVMPAVWWTFFNSTSLGLK